MIVYRSASASTLSLQYQTVLTEDDKKCMKHTYDQVTNVY